jgi:intracellular septation protein
LGPLLIFFFAYKKAGMFYGIITLIIATIISTIFTYILEKKLQLVAIIGAIIVCIFGGLALWFDNKIFFFMKPTIINLIFVIILLYGKIIKKKPLLKELFSDSIILNDAGWNIMTNRWIYFFIFLAALNELVWRTQTEYFWVQFKVFGLMPITFIFAIFQISLIKKYRIEE